MANLQTQHDIGSLGSIVKLCAASTAVAAGAGDATTVTGITIDRQRVAFNGSLPRTALFSVSYDATLTTAKTLAIGYAVQDSGDGAAWSDYQTAASVVVANGSAGLTPSGTFGIRVDLNSARRYVRLNYAPDLNATATDTFVGSAVGFFAGQDRLPA